MHMSKKSGAGLAIAALMLASFALSACNTVAGVGKDLTALGGAMTTAAEENKDDDDAQLAGGRR
jgi:predicted small secreted protein